MNNAQMVAYNTEAKLFLKKVGTQWLVTDSHKDATNYHPREFMQKLPALCKQQKGWMLVDRKDVSKLALKPTQTSRLVPMAFMDEYDTYMKKTETPIAASPAPTIAKRASYAKETSLSENSQEIMKTLRHLDELTGEKRVIALSKELSDWDKQLTDMYHEIEVSNFNAADGYKIYRKMRTLLTSRRQVKNELTLIESMRSKNRKTGILEKSSIEGFDSIASKAWKPQNPVI